MNPTAGVILSRLLIVILSRKAAKDLILVNSCNDQDKILRPAASE